MARAGNGPIASCRARWRLDGDARAARRAQAVVPRLVGRRGAVSASADDPRADRRRARARRGRARGAARLPRGRERRRRPAAEAVVARFCERAAEYRATVRRVAPGGLEDAVVDGVPRAGRAPARGAAGRAAPPARAWSCSSTTRRSPRAASTRSTASSPAARSRSRRRARRARRRRRGAAAARSRSCPTSTSAWSRRRGPRVGARRDRGARARGRRGPAAHVRLRPERHVGHRARARRGRARPAHAGDPGARVIARLLAGALALLLLGAGAGRARASRTRPPGLRRGADRQRQGLALDRARDDHVHQPRHDAAGADLGPAVGQRRRGCARAARPDPNVAGAAQDPRSAAPPSRCGSRRRSPRARAAASLRRRHPRPDAAAASATRRRIALLSNAIPALAHLEGGALAARPLLPARRGVDVPGRGLDVRLDAAARRRGRRARRPAAGRQPPARARARLLVRRRPVRSVGATVDGVDVTVWGVRGRARRPGPRRCGSPASGCRGSPALFGPYGWPDLQIVVTDDAAMEHTGLIMTPPQDFVDHARARRTSGGTR